VSNANATNLSPSQDANTTNLSPSQDANTTNLSPSQDADTTTSILSNVTPNLYARGSTDGDKGTYSSYLAFTLFSLMQHSDE
jgi:hypothetical protein